MAHRHSISSRAALFACVAAIALGACSKSGPETSVADELGAPPKVDTYALEALTKGLITAPDEFSVITRRPLEMPTTVAQLPTPVPGQRSTRVPDPKADARAALARGWGGALVPGQSILPASVRTPARSAVEAAMLSAVGTTDPNIQQTIAADEAARAAREDAYLLDRVIPGLATLRANQNPDVLDVEAEQARLASLNLGIPAAAPVAAPVLANPADPLSISAPLLAPSIAAAPVTPAPNYVTVPLDPIYISPTQTATIPAPVIGAPIQTAPITVQPASAVPTFGSQPVTVRETPGGLIYIE